MSENPDRKPCASWDEVLEEYLAARPLAEDKSPRELLTDFYGWLFTDGPPEALTREWPKHTIAPDFKTGDGVRDLEDLERDRVREAFIAGGGVERSRKELEERIFLALLVAHPDLETPDDPAACRCYFQSAWRLAAQAVEDRPS